MNHLEGTPLTISTTELKKYIGKEVKYLLNKDIDKSGRGYVSPTRFGIIAEVYKKHVDFTGDQDYIPFSHIKEIVLVN